MYALDTHSGDKAQRGNGTGANERSSRAAPVILPPNETRQREPKRNKEHVLLKHDDDAIELLLRNLILSQRLLECGFLLSGRVVVDLRVSLRNDLGTRAALKSAIPAPTQERVQVTVGVKRVRSLPRPLAPLAALSCTPTRPLLVCRRNTFQVLACEIPGYIKEEK